MKILLAVSRYPWPPLSGDRLRTLQCLDFLARDHEVTLLAPEPPPGHPSPPLGATTEFYPAATRADLPRGLLVSLGQRLPWQNAFFHQPALEEKLRWLAPEADLVILQLARLAGYVSALSGTPFAVDFIDSLALSFEVRGNLENWFLKPLFKQEAGRLRRCEARLVDQARGALVVCERDRQAMVAAGPGGADHKVAVLPLAFPLQASGKEGPPEWSFGPAESSNLREKTLVMTGNLGYFPTVDGFSWWLREVWPQLYEKRPDLRVVVAGSRPARRLKRTIERAPGHVELLSSPPSLRSVLAQGAIAIAPMRGGSGQPLKILEAWEAGIPVMASPWAAAGTSAIGGKDLWVAREPEEWAERLFELLDNPQERASFAAEGRLQLTEFYSRERLQRGWSDWIDGLLTT